MIAVASRGRRRSAPRSPTTSSRSRRPTSCCCRSWRSCRCSCWRITSPCAAAAMWTSRATWPRASRWSSEAGHAPDRGRDPRQGTVRDHRDGRALGVAAGRSRRPADAVLPAHLGLAGRFRRTPTRTCRTDLETFFDQLVPEDDRLYRHTIEGADDMPAHIRSALTTVQLSIPVVNGAPPLAGVYCGLG